MSLKYKNLDARTRRLMLEEFELDVTQGTLYLSPRLTDRGLRDYPDLLREAILEEDDGALADKLCGTGRMRTTEIRRTPSGRTTTARVPANAPETLAEGEFNRFYARGLCRRAIEDGIETVVVYRAKAVGDPRPESRRMIGKALRAEELLRDLRIHHGVESALGLLPGPNSGLSVKLP